MNGRSGFARRNDCTFLVFAAEVRFTATRVEGFFGAAFFARVVDGFLAGLATELSLSLNDVFIVAGLYKQAIRLCYSINMSENSRPRTYARNRTISRKGRENIYESDTSYLLKLALVVILGILWLRFKSPLTIGTIAFQGFPVGFFLGLLFISQLEKYQFNRKILYAVLFIVTVLGLFLPAIVMI